MRRRYCGRDFGVGRRRRPPETVTCASCERLIRDRAAAQPTELLSPKIFRAPDHTGYARPVASGAAALYSPPGAGEPLWVLGCYLTIVVPGEAVEDRFALIELLAPHHLSPPLHTHPQDETFFFLDGRLTFLADGERFEVETGATVVVPAGVRHTWRVDSETARMLVLSTPAGLDRLLRDAGVPAAGATLPPPDAGPSPEVVERALREHRHENYGPPLGPDD
jgi:quercetin dioxygenase-like cupin family protein